MPLVYLPAHVAIPLDCLAWAVFHFLTGYIAHRMPLSAFYLDQGIFHLFPWEKEGRIYREFLRIQSWKNKLPEAGDFFAGGFSKKRLLNTQPDYLARFIIESRRGEFTHWLSILPAPLFFLWNHWLVGFFMIIYAVTFNLPFIITNRYNRVRLQILLTRVKSRRHR